MRQILQHNFSNYRCNKVIKFDHHITISIIMSIIFSFSFIQISAQDKKQSKNEDKSISNNINSPTATGDVIEMKDDEENVLFRFRDEGTFGSLQIGSGIPNNTLYKLYNNSGTLYFNGNSLNGGASSIDQLSDAIYDGSSLFLGFNSGSSMLLTNGLNVGIGRGSLNQNTSGSRNTSIGYQSMYSNIIGSGNVCIGDNTNYTGLGNGNTMIGSQSGYGTSEFARSGNIFIGYQAGYFETGSSKLYIENSNSTTPLIWGDFFTDKVKINGDLEVIGTITSSNDIYNIDDLIDAKRSYNSIFLGIDAGLNDEGDNDNIALGDGNLKLNTTGKDNIAIGYQSSRDNINGNKNVAIGTYTNINNAHGSRNTIIGYKAGSFYTANSTNEGNIFIGCEAGSDALSVDNLLYIENSNSNNPLIYGEFTDGFEMVKINGRLESKKNVIFGNNSSVTNTTTGFAIGNNADSENDKSFAIGNDVIASGLNSFAIGNNVTISGTGSMFLGDNSVVSPSSSSADNRFIARFAGGYRLWSDPSLNFGVELNTGANSWSSLSDSTKKENFKLVNGEEILNKISKFKLTTWNYKTQDPNTQRHYGPMAQDFYSAFGNDGIGIIGNDTTIASADFDGINFIAIQALEKRTKEQEFTINELKKINEKLRLQNVVVKTKNSELEHRLSKLESFFENEKFAQTVNKIN